MSDPKPKNATPTQPGPKAQDTIDTSPEMRGDDKASAEKIKETETVSYDTGEGDLETATVPSRG